MVWRLHKLDEFVPIGGAECEPCICDVNDSGELTASDALIVLKAAVGLAADLDCPQCQPSGG